MADSLAALLLPTAQQDSDPTINEIITVPGSGQSYQYKLGSTIYTQFAAQTPPNYPSGVPLVPTGASPVTPPAAPTAGATLTTGNLTANGNYTWALSYVTKYGETLATNKLRITAIGASVTGQTLNLPSATPTPNNPQNVPTMRHLWRSKNDSGATPTLYLVAEIDDANVTTWVDELSDTELVTAAPSSDTSGLTGVVTISGAGTTWTEQPYGTTLSAAGQFIVDYSVGSTGGTITFYSGDAGKTSVTLSYKASFLLTSTYFNLLQSAFNALHSLLPGLAMGVNYLYSGVTPTKPGTGLVMSYAQQQCVIWNAAGTAFSAVTLAAGSLTATDGSGGRDNYFDLPYASATIGNATGTLNSPIVQIAGTAAPSVAAGTIRLWKVTTDGAGNIASVTPIAQTVPIPVGQANGVPSLDQNSRVVQAPARGYRQAIAVVQATNQTSLSSASYTPYPDVAFQGIPITISAGGILLVRLFGQLAMSSGANGIIQFKLVAGGSTVYLGVYEATSTTNTVTVAAMQTISGLSGAVTATLQYVVTAGTTWYVNGATPNSNGLALELVEYA